MKNIRIIGRTYKNEKQGTIRIFKIGEEEKAIAFMKDWIKYGDNGDLVFAWYYKDGKQAKFLRGFKKV